MLLGLEISATFASAVLADANGVAQYSLRQDFAPHAAPASQWLSAMALCRDLLHRSAVHQDAVSCLGIAFDAPVSVDAIVQKDPTRPGWEGYDLARGAREHLHIQKVVATSRVNAEALAEAQFGALRGHNDWLYLHLGRMLESSLCLGGSIRLGNGGAGDIGALILERDGPLDAYGGRGTLRAFCGGEAFESRARTYGLTFTAASDVWKVAASSNFAAQSLVEEFTSRLAQGLSGALTLLQPGQICVGGAFGIAIWNQIHGPLASKLRDMMPGSFRPSLILAQLGEDAAPLGALTLALRASP